MRAVRERGARLIDDPGRPAGVVSLGTDETASLRAKGTRPKQYGTPVVDLSQGRAARVPDTVPSGFGIVLAEWLAVRDPAWRGGIAFAALDPFDGNAALLTELPRRAADARPFHVVRLGFQAVDGVRRRA